MALTTAFDLFYKRAANIGAAVTYGGRATAGNFQTASFTFSGVVGDVEFSQSFYNFPNNVLTGKKYATTRTGSSPTLATSGSIAIPWTSPAADFLWNCTVPAWSESKHQTTYVTQSTTYNYTSSKWTVNLDRTSSFFYNNPPSGQNAGVYGTPSYNITSSWHVIDGKFLSSKNIYPTGGQFHYCIRDSRINTTQPSNTNPTYIGSNPDYGFTANLTKELFATESAAGAGGVPFPDRSTDVGYTVTWPIVKASSTSSFYGGYFDKGGGAGITQTLISQSIALFDVGVALTASNPTIGLASMSRALAQRRLFFPTPVSASGTNGSQDYWFKQFTGQKAVDIFNEDGGIYNVQFTIKRYIGRSTPYSSSLYQPRDRRGNPIGEPYTIYFYRESNDYFPDPGTYLNVFISDVQTKLTSSTALVEGTSGWYPPDNNIITIGNGYGPSPIMTFYDTTTGYQLERFNINLIQYGYPAQLCFEPSGNVEGNSFFGCIIDDVLMCKIGVTTDTRFTKNKTVTIKTVNRTEAIGNALGQVIVPICCFLPGTLISMGDGSTKKIEDILEGDVIISYDEDKQINVLDAVVSPIQKIRGDIVTYTFEDGSDVKATPDHPLYTTNKGWASADPGHTKIVYDMDVECLEIGDTCYHISGVSKQITDILREDIEPTIVYTFGTETTHNYYANGFLAHNKVCPGGTRAI